MTRLKWTAMAVGISLVGCSSSTTSGTNTGGSTGYNLTGGGSTTGGGGATTFQLRLANIASSVSAFDYCLAPAGTAAFVGPLLANVGFSRGLPLGNMTHYATMLGGQYDLRLVAVGASGCAQADSLVDFTSLAPFAIGSLYTLLVSGTSGTPRLTVLTDTPQSSIDGSHAGLRFIDVAPGGPGSLDLGDSSTGAFVAWLTGASLLTPGGSPQQGLTLDANGYLLVPAQSSVLLTVRASGASTALVTLTPYPMTQLSLAPSQEYTLFAVPTVSPLGAVLCSDTAPVISDFVSCVQYPLPPQPVFTTAGTTGGSPTGAAAGTTGGGTTGGIGTTTGGFSTTAGAGTSTGSDTGTGSGTSSGGSTTGGTSTGGCDTTTCTGTSLCSVNGQCCPGVGTGIVDSTCTPGNDCQCVTLNCVSGVCM